MSGAWARIPIRLRITLAFAAAMAVLLAAIGLFVRQSMAGDLDDAIDDQLRARASDLLNLVEVGDDLPLAEPENRRLGDPEESFAQILSRFGVVIDASVPPGDAPVLNEAEAARALEGELLLERERVEGVDGTSRLLAAPADADGRPQKVVVVVGSSLDDRDETLAGLTTLLALGGGGALVLASLAGYVVAGLALRPVESMRRRASLVSGADPGARLPIPPADDEIGRLGRTLNDMLARVDATMERERAFVADASHELRTPLAILKTELELALRGDRTAGELRAALVSAGHEADRLVRLAEDLLVIARADHGRLPVRTAPVAVPALLERIRGRYAARAAEAGRTIGAEAPGGLVVPADALRLEQAVGNLIDNALVHGRGDVRLRAAAENGHVALHVLDEGPGIRDDVRRRAFERFARSGVARAQGGAGLGLAIVRAIARAHGGEAHLAPRPGGGTDAWIALPLRPPDA